MFSHVLHPRTNLPESWKNCRVGCWGKHNCEQRIVFLKNMTKCVVLSSSGAGGDSEVVKGNKLEFGSLAETGKTSPESKPLYEDESPKTGES